jgi:hypothetical protein
MPLQDSDNFIVGRGTDSYKISYQDLKDDLNYVPPPTGTINTPTVLEPNDGAGGGDTRYLKSDAITEVEGGGVDRCETELIESVDDTTDAPNIILTFPDSTGFDCFADGDVVQNEVYSENWSPYLTIPAGHSWGTSVYPDSNNLDAFDGDLTNFAAVVSPYADTSWTFTFPEKLTGSNNFTIYARGAGMNSTAVTCTLYDADGNQVYYKATPDSWAGGISDLQFNFTNITNVKSCVYVNSGNAGDGAAVYGFELNGKLLIDNSLATDQVKIVGEPDSDNNTIVVDGGEWTGSDGSGTLGEQTTLVKETPYDTKLTVAGSTDLADMTGSTFMSDGAGAPGPYSQTPYKLVTTDIESVSSGSIITASGTWSNTDAGGGDAANFFIADQRILTGSAASATVIGTVSGAPATNVVHVHAGRGNAPETSGAVGTLKINGETTVYTATAIVPPAPPISNASYGSGSYGSFTFNLPSSVTITSFEFNQEAFGSTAQVLYGIWFGDKQIVNGETSPDFVLTFPGDVSTNPDLRYFKPGDVVQGETSFDMGGGTATADKTPYGQFGTSTDINVVMNGRVIDVADAVGFYGSNALEDSSKTCPVSITCYPNNRIPPNAVLTVVYIYGNLTETIDNNFLPTITSVNGSPVSITPVGLQASTTNINAASAVINFGNTEEIYSFIISFPDAGGYNPVLFGFVSEEFSPPAKVISTGYPDSNTMVVDGGDWVGTDGSRTTNPVRDFVGDFVIRGTGEVRDGYPIENAFDGTPGTVCSTTTPCEVHFNPPYPVKNKVEFLRGPESIAGISVKLYYKMVGDTSYNGPVSPAANNWTTLFTGSGNIEEILVVPKTHSDPDTWSTGTVQIDGFKIDDKSVFDISLSPVKYDTHVEYQTKGGQGDIVSVNTDDNTLLISNTGDRDNRWIKGFSVAGPSIIDEPLLTNDVQLRSSDFATTPPDSDTLKEIIWDIDGTEYSAGVTNPWKPLNNLTPNTTHTVKVKYKGNVLEDSNWSPTVSFTTGATLRSLFTRIAALEANDVTDDATDTALITLIAGLAARIQALEESN